MVVVNAFPGFIESIGTEAHVSLLSVLMLSTFLLIVFRFGFANIMLAQELSKQDVPLPRREKINHLVSFLILTFAAIMLGLMSYYINWTKHGATMYIQFLVLCVVDCVWDISSWWMDRSATFRLQWLANKIWYVAVFAVALFAFREDFHPFSKPTGNPVWDHVFLFLIFITWLSSIVSLVIGRRLFFPFLFQDASEPPPPLLPHEHASLEGQR